MGKLTTLSSIFDPMNHFIPEERDTSKYPRGTPEEQELLRTSREMRAEAGAFAPVVRQRLAELADPSKQQAQARGRGNADVMQASARDGATPFDRAMRRGRALSRVALQNDQAVRLQNMRDRIGMQRFGSALRSGNTRELDASSDRTAEGVASRMRNMQISQAATANMQGSIVGGLAGIFSDRQRGRSANTSMMMDTPSSGFSGTLA